MRERNDDASVEEARNGRRRNRRKARSTGAGAEEEKTGEGKGKERKARDAGVTVGRVVQEEESIERWKSFRTRSPSIGQAN